VLNELTNETHTPTPSPPAFDPALDGDDLEFRAIFHPLGFAIEIATNRPEVLEAAAELWGFTSPLRECPVAQIRILVSGSSSTECPPGPTYNCQRHLVTLIADSDNYATCDLRASFGFARITHATLRHRLYLQYHFLEAMALGILSAINAPALHAACVSLHDQGFLLCGPSGAGKSTLSYACARAGFVYTTDDASYLLRQADHPRVVGQSHKIRFRPHGRQLFPELQGRTLTPRMEGKPSIEVPTVELRIHTAEEVPIHHLVLLDRQFSGKASIEYCATSIAIERLQEGLYPTLDIRQEQISAMRILENLPTWKLRYSRLDEAIDCLRSLTGAKGYNA
jgi:hypothetical protein